jgi:hypothetical protein
MPDYSLTLEWDRRNVTGRSARAGYAGSRSPGECPDLRGHAECEPNPIFCRPERGLI